ADSHVMEPVDLWTSGLPAQLRAHGPRVEPRDGVACLLVEDTVVRRFPPLAKAAGPADAPDEKTFMHGASDPAGRLRDLDTDGVWGEVIYPNLAFFCCFHIRSPELQIETARLYNEWVAEQFIAASERVAPVAGLPVNDIAAAVEELWRAARRGFRGAVRLGLPAPRGHVAALPGGAGAPARGPAREHDRPHRDLERRRALPLPPAHRCGVSVRRGRRAGARTVRSP